MLTFHSPHVETGDQNQLHSSWLIGWVVSPYRRVDAAPPPPWEWEWVMFGATTLILVTVVLLHIAA